MLDHWWRSLPPQCVAAENPNVTAMALHPSIVKTDMTLDSFMKFADDTPELVGGVGDWLAHDQVASLSGNYISANWSVEELFERREDILSEAKLSVGLAGKFSADQFALIAEKGLGSN